jgi:hypothetical protein
MTVLAASTWRTNADLIVDCAKLGYLRKEWITLDPTYGRGNWWTAWQPDVLIKHDLYKLDGVDFRDLPEDAGTMDAVAYDPPYVSVGSRKTTTIPEFLDNYGLVEAPASPSGLQELINDGLIEVHRVLRKRGMALVKCASYVSSGRLWPGDFHTQAHAAAIGFDVVDVLRHIGNVRQQPERTRKCAECDGEQIVPDPVMGLGLCQKCEKGRVRSPQAHARQNYSTLLVLRKK